MTLNTLKTKLDDLQKQKDQVLANLNALMGAVQAIEQLIAEEEKSADEPQTEPQP